MEPRSFDRGKSRQRPARQRCDPASMEPRSFDRGKAQALLGKIRSEIASMEPRSFDRGKYQCNTIPQKFSKLQWSRDRLIAERRPKQRFDKS